MLAGIPVPAEAVEELAELVREAGAGDLADRLERHYGRLLQGSGDAIRGKLDAYVEGLGQESPAASDTRVSP